MKKKTNNEFLQELNEKNPHIKPLEEYHGANTKIKCKCLICNYIWMSTPNNLLHTKNCPNCVGNVKMTNEQFLEKLYSITNNILPLEECSGTDNKILCKCLICNNEWYIKPKKLLKGQSCPICANKQRREGKYKVSKKEFEEKIKKLGYTAIDQYQGLSVAINFRCDKCGYQFHTTPSRLISKKTSCKNCFNISLRKTNEQFINELNLINPDIEPLSEYINSYIKIKYKCKICNSIHSALPSNLLRGYGCPDCYASKGEKRCKKFFDEHHIKYIPQYEFDDLKGIKGKNLRFDFGVIYNNKLLLVEYDGIFHYEQQYEGDGFEILKTHDNLKNEYCEKHNIPLLRIPYWDYDNIENILKENLVNN